MVNQLLINSNHLELKQSQDICITFPNIPMFLFLINAPNNHRQVLFNYSIYDDDDKQSGQPFLNIFEEFLFPFLVNSICIKIL